MWPPGERWGGILGCQKDGNEARMLLVLYMVRVGEDFVLMICIVNFAQHVHFITPAWCSGSQ